MAIYLDDQTRVWLERKVKDIKSTDFVGERVRKMLEADRQRLDDMAECEHVAAEYVGHRTCCSKCSAFFDEGMGQSWTLKELTQSKGK